MAQEKTSKDEQIGFHKGSLATLAKEREELARILSIVEQLMQMHVKGLQELGVDIQKMAEDAAVQLKKAGKIKDNKPIEDMLK